MFTRKEDETDNNAYMQRPSGFGSSADHASAPASSGREMNVISKGTHIQGDVQTDGDIRIEGEVKGTIRSSSKVVVGRDGFVDGDVLCVHAEILGRVKGSLTVQEHLNLKGDAKMEGDVLTTHLEMEPSVRFNGKCTMQDKVELPSLSRQKEEKPSASSGALFKNNPVDKANAAKEEKPANGVAQKQAV